MVTRKEHQMAMTPDESVKLKREVVARMQDEVARHERALTNAKYMLEVAEEDLDAATAVASAAQGVP